MPVMPHMMSLPVQHVKKVPGPLQSDAGRDRVTNYRLLAMGRRLLLTGRCGLTSGAFP
jgi:hypothetical protein